MVVYHGCSCIEVPSAEILGLSEVPSLMPGVCQSIAFCAPSAAVKSALISTFPADSASCRMKPDLLISAS